jgi:precorrin-2/cobalt-factor-2 C20-methyltransferase
VTLGRCFGIGVGPGDPELLTLKAARVLAACPVVASFHARGRLSNARRVVEQHLGPQHEELELIYPVTTERVDADRYETLLIDFYDESAKRVAEVLDAGTDVAVLCEGDPLFYGSFMYLQNRLAGRYATEIVPGVPSAVAGAAAVGVPLAARDDVLTVLSGTLAADELAHRVADADAVVILKVGRNLDKVRAAVREAGRLDGAFYVARATMAGEIVAPLADADADAAPYFSLVVIPSVVGRRR